MPWWSVVFWKNVFMHMEYVVLFLSVFLYFIESYDNVSTSKYVYISHNTLQFGKFKWFSKYRTIFICYSNGDLNSGHFVHYFLVW